MSCNAVEAQANETHKFPLAALTKVISMMNVKREVLKFKEIAFQFIVGYSLPSLFTAER